MEKGTASKIVSDKKINFAGSAYNSFLIWGVPASLSTAVSTIVDVLLIGIFVGSEGLVISNLATPVYLFYALCGVTVGIGANVKIGRLLGSSDEKEANRVFSSQLTVGIVLALICLSPIFFQKTYYTFLGVTDDLYAMADRYLRIVLWSAPTFILYHIFSASVRTDGNPKLSAIASTVVIISQLSMDILFIKVLKFGILGASVSICTAELLGLLVLLMHFFKKHKALKLRLSIPKLRDIGSFIWNGFSSGSAYIFTAIVMLVFNNLLLNYEDNGIIYTSIYAVLYTVSTIPSAFYDGSAVALSTVSPFLVGEGDTDGVRFIHKRALIFSAVTGAISAILCGAFSKQIIGFFNADASYAPYVLQIYAVCIVPLGINTVTTSYWQSIGRVKFANVLSLFRNCLLILAFGILFIPKVNVTGVALAYCATEYLCLIAVIAIELTAPSRKYIVANYSKHDKCYENDYPIDKDSMGQISADIAQVCDEWKIDIKQAFLINFVCEELLLNIIKFALGESKSKKRYYLSVKLIARGDDYILCVKDNVRLYNPLEAKGDDIDNGVLNLIKKKSKCCEYQRKLIFNYLYLVI